MAEAVLRPLAIVARGEVPKGVAGRAYGGWGSDLGQRARVGENAERCARAGCWKRGYGHL